MDPLHADLLRTTDPVELGARVKALRVARGFTQAQLAGAEMSVGYVSRMESGQRRPTAKVLTILADRLEAPLAQLLGGVAPSEVDEVRLLLDYAELSLESGEPAETERQTDEALARLEGFRGVGGLTDLLHRAGFLRARAYEGLGRLDDAILGFEDLLDGGATGLVQVTAALALSRSYRDSGDLTRAIEVGDRTMAELVDTDLDGCDEAVQLAVTVASAYFELGDEGHAVRLCRRAIAQAESTGSPVARASAYWNASVMQADRGRIDEALPLAERALALLGEGKETRNLAVLRAELGRMQLSLDPPDVEAARRNLDQARKDLAWASARPRDLAGVDLLLARVCVAVGDVSAARELIGTVSEVTAEAPLVAVEALVLQGEIAAAERDLAAAAAAYQRAVAILTAVGSDREAAQLWFDLAHLLESVHLTDAARDAYRRAAASSGLRARPRTASPTPSQLVDPQTV